MADGELRRSVFGINLPAVFTLILILCRGGEREE
jgi:hypothetical protein